MDRNPLVKLVDLMLKFKIVRHKKRQEFVVELVKALISSRSVVFSELADKMNKLILAASAERRIQDFFQKTEFDYDQLLVLLVCFVPHEKLILSLDRTEWDRGKQQYNILCVIASIGKMGVPLYFEMLDNKSGNSNAEDRIKVLKKIIQIIGSDRIAVLNMDREFIGCTWLRWLKSQGVPFCVRVPKHHLITLSDGFSHQALALLAQNDGHLVIDNVVVDTVAVNLCLSKDDKGEMLFLIGTVAAAKLKETYRKRWTIEVFFQALKKRGFHIESTGLLCKNKLRKLFALTSLAYTVCWITGIEEGKKNPVKPKKHGYPQYSVFRRGLNILRTAFKSGICDLWNNIYELVFLRRQNLDAKTIG